MEDIEGLRNEFNFRISQAKIHIKHLKRINDFNGTDSEFKVYLISQLITNHKLLFQFDLLISDLKDIDDCTFFLTYLEQ